MPARRYLQNTQQTDASPSLLQNTQQTKQTNVYTLSEIRTQSPSNPAAADLCLKQNGDRDWLMKVITVSKWRG